MLKRTYALNDGFKQSKFSSEEKRFFINLPSPKKRLIGSDIKMLLQS